MKRLHTAIIILFLFSFSRGWTQSISVITVSPVTGSIHACAGTPSASPNVEHFAVSGTNLTGDIVIIPPPGFEVSSVLDNSYTNISATFLRSGNSTLSFIVYIRSAATAPVGNISGNVIVTSAGTANQSIPISGVITDTPIVNVVNNQSVANGSSTTAVNFTGTANTYGWANDSPNIGLPANGTGNISPFTAVNTSVNPIVAHIKVTPVNSGFAYIPNYDSNTVSVISTITNGVQTTIPVGAGPAGVWVSPDWSKVYVSNHNSNNVSVINTSTNTVIATIPVGAGPNGLVISQDGSRVYVANSNNSTISVINTSTNTVTELSR
jgi:YVTN family beta-propeller protein